MSVAGFEAVRCFSQFQFISFHLIKLWFCSDLPRSDPVSRADQQQVASHLQPATEGRDLRAIDFLPCHRSLGDRNPQTLRLIQQIDVERPEKKKKYFLE